MKTNTRSRPSHVRCVYCREQEPRDELRRCKRCGTICHVACRHELDSCPTLGCSREREATPSRTPVPEARPGARPRRRRGERIVDAAAIAITVIVIFFVGRALFRSTGPLSYDMDARLDGVEAMLARGEVTEARTALGALHQHVMLGYISRDDGSFVPTPDGPMWRARPRYKAALERCHAIEEQRSRFRGP